MTFDQEETEKADLENDDSSMLQNKQVGTKVSHLVGGDDDGADYDADTETDGVNSAMSGLLQDKVPLVEETESDLVTAKQSEKEDAPVDAITKTTLFKIRRLINGSSLNRAFKDHEAGVAVLSKHREGVVKCARHLSSSSLVKSKAAISSLMPLAKGCQIALQGKDLFFAGWVSRAYHLFPLQTQDKQPTPEFSCETAVRDLQIESCKMVSVADKAIEDYTRCRQSEETLLIDALHTQRSMIAQQRYDH